MINRVIYDEAFKIKAVELSYARGSVKEAAQELGVDQSRLSKWRVRYKEGAPVSKVQVALTDDQKELIALRKELKESNLERDILKKAVHIFSREDGKFSGL